MWWWRYGHVDDRWWRYHAVCYVHAEANLWNGHEPLANVGAFHQSSGQPFIQQHRRWLELFINSSSSFKKLATSFVDLPSQNCHENDTKMTRKWQTIKFLMKIYNKKDKNLLKNENCNCHKNVTKMTLKWHKNVNENVKKINFLMKILKHKIDKNFLKNENCKYQ